MLAAVGPRMTEVAAETADGMIVHPFRNETYLRTVTLAAIERALAKAGRRREDFELSYAPFVVSGRTEEEFAANRRTTTERIAFYGSTPAFREVLECIGHGDLQGELNRLSKERKWQEMGTLIDDNLLHHFAVVAEPDGVVPELLKCYGGLVDRTSASFDFVDVAHRADMIRTLRAG